MRKTILLTLVLTLASCASTSNNSRSLSSIDRELNGSYLAVADYKFGHNGPNKAAARLYLQEIEGENGNYNAILLEYVDLLKMAPSYITSNKMPFIAKKIGFLKNITSNIAAYRVVPGKKDGTFDMWPLVVDGDQIKAKRDGKPRVLTLASDNSQENPLAGATISSVNDSQPEQIFFPAKDDDKSNGVQYSLAKFTYAKAKLESTWRKTFLTGDYLSQYAKVNDVVLNLSGSGDNQIADFIINPSMSKMSSSKRAKMFTNEKSAFLKGQFSVTEPIDGMFLFAPVKADAKTNEIVKGKIALFIDIFDATKSLNQDVVELALIDSEKPSDFLMYYEHPENGEGK